MKRIFNLVILVVFVFALVSCATKKWTNVSGNINLETLMQEKFPKLYPSYKSGEIVVTKIEDRIDENGKTQYRITYTDKSDDDEDWDAFMWQTIYMPMLNN
ncbi:MAG: hypothetical protein IKV83_03010 [Muribaculaceae bacterium]|nr:hypothetical protein [Muribaculaceae bacterium]